MEIFDLSSGVVSMRYSKGQFSSAVTACVDNFLIFNNACITKDFDIVSYPTYIGGRTVEIQNELW